MAIMPGAVWRGPLPASNYAKGRAHPIVGVTIHHMDGTLASTDSVFRQPGYQRSAHFGTGRDGTIYQWVDTDDVSYHACNANWTGYIGIENDDQGDDLPLTTAQLVAIHSIIVWLGVPLVPMANMTDAGIGYHGQFPGDCSTHWGRTACPGVMVDQIPAIISLPAPPPLEVSEVQAVRVTHPSDAARIDVFYVTDQKHLIQKNYPGSGPVWNTYDLMAGCYPGATPTAEWASDGSRIDVFVPSDNGGLAHYWYDGKTHSEVV